MNERKLVANAIEIAQLTLFYICLHKHKQEKKRLLQRSDQNLKLFHTTHLAKARIEKRDKRVSHYSSLAYNYKHTLSKIIPDSTALHEWSAKLR